MHMRHARLGVTMLELLVVLAVILVLVGITVVAVVRAREGAARVESENKLRQIILATHSFAAAYNTRLPTVGAEEGSANPYQALFVAILPYLDDGEYNRVDREGPYPPVYLFLSPADPTAPAAVADAQGVSSYAANAQVFQDNPRLAATILDGTSNTIGYAEHYSYKCGEAMLDRTFVYWDMNLPGTGSSRATFADFGGVMPVTSGDPPVTEPTNLGFTFQLAPAVSSCDGSVPQTPHMSGMLVAMMDGSVRSVAFGISERTFWAAVTPSAGDSVGSDWND
jgi:prepilin-type N-terminal cleavage/methylation domain-containing protein